MHNIFCIVSSYYLLQEILLISFTLKRKDCILLEDSCLKKLSRSVSEVFVII